MIVSDMNTTLARQADNRRPLLTVAQAADELGVSRQHAYRLIAEGRLPAVRLSGANAVQVQRWLGHHSPAFTLSTYVHLLDAGVGDALALEVELGQCGSDVSNNHPRRDVPKPSESVEAGVVD